MPDPTIEIHVAVNAGQEETPPAVPAAPPGTVNGLLLALFLSGMAAMINQTVWQRALKVYLAGCESISAMIVVLAFMLGLGAGSLFMGLKAHRVRNPLRLLGTVEILLFAINLAIAALLRLDLSESIYSFQRLAVSLGIPLRLLYGVISGSILFAPCFLMGITMPLVSEAFQRQLNRGTPGVLTLLFVLNTLGSVAGGLCSGFYLLSHLGQRTSLLAGAAANCAAGVIILLHRQARRAGGAPRPAEAAPGGQKGRLTTEEVMGFWLGFLSLGYEMYLLRNVALAHLPLPYNFSLVLCCFLFFWSAGVFAAKRIEECIPLLLVVSALLASLAPAYFFIDRLHPLRRFLGDGEVFASAAIYTLPCLPFGALFGQVVSRAARRWGNDVGRYHGLNTIGSCLGILAITLVGLEMNQGYVALAISAGYLALWRHQDRRIPGARAAGAPGRLARWARVAALAALAIGLPLHILYDLKPGLFARGRVSYYSKDGVVEITRSGAMIWDGLLHSTLSTNGNHLGSNNWLLAAVPYLCHEEGPIDDALVIGLGTGITAGTLARSDRIASVDVYEINRKLEQVLRDYPEGTLGVLKNPKVHFRWRDGRTGLAIDGKKYDLVTQQPTYLKQAGSSLLLSREYMRLVSSRLKNGGIFCIYSNSHGNRQQALLVRQTAKAVFAHCLSFGDGYMVLASNEPFSYRCSRIEDPECKDPLMDEVRAVGLEVMKRYLDSPAMKWEGLPCIITDDHPVVEYPDVVAGMRVRPD
jgi:spermidine synthase